MPGMGNDKNFIKYSFKSKMKVKYKPKYILNININIASKLKRQHPQITMEKKHWKFLPSPPTYKMKEISILFHLCFAPIPKEHIDSKKIMIFWKNSEQPLTYPLSF